MESNMVGGSVVHYLQNMVTRIKPIIIFRHDLFKSFFEKNLIKFFVLNFKKKCHRDVKQTGVCYYHVSIFWEKPRVDSVLSINNPI